MCTKIRSIAEYDTIKIFMLTSEMSPDSFSKGKELKISAWIIKPVKKDKLIAAIDKLFPK